MHTLAIDIQNDFHRWQTSGSTKATRSCEGPDSARVGTMVTASSDNFAERSLVAQLALAEYLTLLGL